MIIQICVGSEKFVGLIQDAIAVNHLENQITLTGQFCSGNCNRVGVTIQVDDDVYTGVTPEGFREFFQEKVLKKIN